MLTLDQGRRQKIPCWTNGQFREKSGRGLSRLRYNQRMRATKRVVYFTGGEGVLDEQIRARLARIPEVLSVILAAQKELDTDWDLLSSLLVPEEFNSLSPLRRRFLINLVQEGIYRRWKKRFRFSAEVIRRTQFSNLSSIKRKLEGYLLTHREVVVFLIGPGGDELSLLLRQKNVRFVEVICTDPRLNWFWEDVSGATVGLQ